MQLAQVKFDIDDADNDDDDDDVDESYVMRDSGLLNIHITHEPS